MKYSGLAVGLALGAAIWLATGQLVVAICIGVALAAGLFGAAAGGDRTD